MKLLIDDANLDAIRELNRIFPVEGVTTNPSILKKEGKDPFTCLEEIREIIGPDKELHVQAVSKTADGMVAEAQTILDRLGKTTFVKIPVTREGLEAIKRLKAKGTSVTATAIYSPLQAYLAAQAGADYIAPYVNRIDNLGYDGLQVAKQIEDLLRGGNYPTQILAASFKNGQQVLSLAAYGVGAATVSTDVLNSMLENPTVDAAVDAFIRDFETLTSPGATMMNS